MQKNGWLLIVALVVTSFSQGVELDFVLLKDIIATPTYYYYYYYGYYYPGMYLVQPFGALLAVGFPITDVFRFRVRGAYTGAAITMEENRYLKEFNSNINGFRLQGVAMASAPLNSEKLLLQAGIGLGYHHYTVESEKKYYYEYYEAYEVEARLSGFTQTFILGARVPISERIGVVMEVERIGLNLIKEIYKIYDENGNRVADGEENYIEPDNSLNIGLSAGLHLMF